MKDVYK